MAQKKQGPRPKHVPQRTCIACRQTGGKRSLLRIVRTEQGIEVDSTGKKPGRGAYLHPYRKCWQAVLRGDRLAQTLRTQLSESNRQALIAYMATLPESESSSESGADSAAEDAPLAAKPSVRPSAEQDAGLNTKQAAASG